MGKSVPEITSFAPHLTTAPPPGEKVTSLHAPYHLSIEHVALSI